MGSLLLSLARLDPPAELYFCSRTSRAYNSDVKMEQLWDMLLKSSLEREDVATLEQVTKKTQETCAEACQAVNFFFLFLCRRT